jgi:hypothetical protein
MKASFLGNLSMFASSYYLVFVYLIFGVKSLNEKILFWKISYSWIIFASTLVIMIILILYLFKWKKLPTNRFQIIKKENTSAETLNYILTILLTIISITTFSWNLLILLLLIYLIYIAGSIYYLQPLLMLLGYKVFKCQIEGNNEIMIITKYHIRQNKKYTFHELFDSTYILRSDEDDN